MDDTPFGGSTLKSGNTNGLHIGSKSLPALSMQMNTNGDNLRAKYGSKLSRRKVADHESSKAFSGDHTAVGRIALLRMQEVIGSRAGDITACGSSSQ
jgi:hypothetical protein